MFAANYGAVERALIQAFGVRKDDVAAFHGRVIALQKAGLLGAENMPGKGKPLVYGPDLYHRLVFACELLQFGITPRVIVGTVNDLWERRIRAIFKLAAKAAMQDPGDDDVVMYFGGVKLMTDNWADAVPNVNRCKLKDLPWHANQWMRMREEDHPPGNLPPRVILANLSHRLRRFYAGLAEAPPPQQRKKGTS
jgi:hypothetical protein